MACPKCGREVSREQFPLGLTFCPYCGDKVSGHDPSQGIAFCPYCGRRLLISATFCPECGKQIAFGAGAVPYSAAATAPAFSGITPPPRMPCHSETEAASPYTPEEPPPPSRPIWPMIVSGCKRLYKPVESFVTGRWRLKRLYQDWSVHDALPPDEIPSDDYLKNMPRQASSPAQRLPLWLILLAAVAAILVFVVIGILIRRA
ncbi:MAG: zinc ribbon domain-containing protein [Dehalococcoidia bacterium]|nr:zinc ribbon domain-containing protein [Dehalococcoidia bacterium]